VRIAFRQILPNYTHPTLLTNQPVKPLLTRETPGNTKRGPDGGAIPVERPGWRRWRERPPGPPIRSGSRHTQAEKQ